MEDLINRQAVLNGLASIAKAKSDAQKSLIGRIMFFTEHLPSIKPHESMWIPVSERLPESCGMYIVTRKIYDCPDTAPIIMSDESWFDGQNTWHNDNRINHERGYLSDVIAWMPLPEPYEPQKKQCADCNHYGKFSLDCGRCDDDCSMFEPQEREDGHEKT